MRKQIRRGNLEHILLSHGMAFKICLARLSLPGGRLHGTLTMA